MKRFKKTVSASLALAVLIPSVAFTAPADIHYKSSKELFEEARVIGSSPKLQRQVGSEGFKYYYEGRDGKLYDFIKADNVFNGLENQEMGDLLNALDKEEEDDNLEEKELKVESVSAITDTAFKGVAKQLEFAINGETKAVDVAKLKEAGYTVTYKATKNVTADGKVTSSEDFKYNIIVTKDDVEFETGMTDVKVIDGKAPAKLNKVSVVQNGAEVDTVVVSTTDLVKLRVDEYVNRAGEVKKLKEGESDLNLNDIKLESKNKDIVVVKNGELMPVQAGKATVEVTMKGMETYTVTIEVSADARKATTIEGFENLELSVSEGLADEETFDIVVKDQYGVKIDLGDDNITIENVDESVATAKFVEDSKDKLEVKALKEGSTKITLEYKDVKASFNVVVKKAGDIATYHLEVVGNKGTVLDKNVENEEKLEQDIEVKFVGRDKDGLLVKELNVTDADVDPKIEIKSSDDDVIKVNAGNKMKFNAVDVGKAKIVATITEGTLVTVKEELEVEVINTTKPTIEGEMKLGQATIITGEDNVYTVEYDKTNVIGEAKVVFSQPVKVSAKIGGTKLTAEQLADIMAKTGTNLYGYVSEIKTDTNIASTYEELGLKGNFDVEVELENESGYTETFTFKFVEEIPAEEDAE